MIPLKNVLSRGGIHICGVCRVPRSKLADAARCLARCSLRFLDESFRPPLAKKGMFVCRICLREFSRRIDAEKCVDDCRIDWERDLYEMLSHLGISDYYRRLKHNETLVQILEEDPPRGNSRRGANRGTNGGANTTSSDDDTFLSIERLNSSGDKPAVDGGENHNNSEKKVEDDVWGDVMDLRVFESDMDAALKELEDDVPSSGLKDGKLKNKKIGEAKWVRAGSKYKCSLCKKTFFTRAEAEACYDAH